MEEQCLQNYPSVTEPVSRRWFPCTVPAVSQGHSTETMEMNFTARPSASKQASAPINGTKQAGNFAPLGGGTRHESLSFPHNPDADHAKKNRHCKNVFQLCREIRPIHEATRRHGRWRLRRARRLTMATTCWRAKFICMHDIFFCRLFSGWIQGSFDVVPMETVACCCICLSPADLECEWPWSGVLDGHATPCVDCCVRFTTPKNVWEILSSERKLAAINR